MTVGLLTVLRLLETGLPSFDIVYVCVQMLVLIFALGGHTVTTPGYHLIMLRACSSY